MKVQRKSHSGSSKDKVGESSKLSPKKPSPKKHRSRKRKHKESSSKRSRKRSSGSDESRRPSKSPHKGDKGPKRESSERRRDQAEEGIKQPRRSRGSERDESQKSPHKEVKGPKKESSELSTEKHHSHDCFFPNLPGLPYEAQFSNIDEDIILYRLTLPLINLSVATTDIVDLIPGCIEGSYREKRLFVGIPCKTPDADSVGFSYFFHSFIIKINSKFLVKKLYKYTYVKL